MKQPDLRSAIAAHSTAVYTTAAYTIATLTVVLSSPLASHRASAQALPDEIADNWYKTELLIFTRDPDSSNAERWDPEPQLAYPERTRFLIDTALAEQRLEENQAYTSTLTDDGVQLIQVAAPIEELLNDDRPDALITAPPEPLADEVGELPATDSQTLSQPGAAAASSAPEPNAPFADELLELIPDPNEPVLALPYQLLDKEDLEFTAQAGSLRRQGHSIAFHGAWWARLDEAAETVPVLLDRSGDSDTEDWPPLQGSVHMYRSRYLHIDVNLWLNTLGAYLPQGWTIEPPPLAQPSLLAHTISGAVVDLWAVAEENLPAAGPAAPPVLLPDTSTPSSYTAKLEAYARSAATADAAVADTFADAIPTADNALRSGAAAPDASTAAVATAAKDTQDAEAAAKPLRIYPWSHAIPHRQTRRMRSGEIHYLDHPIIGVIVRISPASEEQSPLLQNKEAARDFRARHNTGAPLAEALDGEPDN